MNHLSSSSTPPSRFLLLVGGIILLLLAPLPFLGDLRAAFSEYLLLTVVATLLLGVGCWFSFRNGGGQLRARHILLVAGLLRLSMLPMMPSLSDDPYRYLWDGRLLLHGQNPYHLTPAETTVRDDLFQLQGYPTTHTIYPPGAQLLFAGAVAVGKLFGGGWQWGYFVWKLMVIAAELLAIVLLLRLLQSQGLPVARGVLYAWHPLVVIELAGQAHTDAFWVLAIAAMLWGFASGSRGKGLPAAVVGGAVRVFPFVALPLWWRFLPRRELLVALAWSAGGLLLLAPFLDPVAAGNYLEVMLRFTNYYEFNGGFYYGAKWLLDAFQLQPSNQIAGGILLAIQLVAFLCIWFWPTADRSVRSLAWRMLLLLTFQIVLPAKVHVWYFVAPLFLLPLTWDRGLRWGWWWLALVAPFTYVAYTGPTVMEPSWLLALEWSVFGMLAVAEYVWKEEAQPTMAGL